MLQEIFAVSETGGPAERLTGLDRKKGENSHRYPSLLGDGSEFLYFIRSDNADIRGIYIASLNDANARTRLTISDGPFAVASDRDRNLTYVISQQAGKMVAQSLDRERKQLSAGVQVLIAAGAMLSASDNGILAARITRLDLTNLIWRGETGEKLATFGEGGEYWSVDISPDDAWVAVVKHNSANGEFTVWVASTKLGFFDRVSESAHAFSLCWSHDSTALYYADTRDGILYRRKIAVGSPEEVIADVGTAAEIEDVSPSGQYIVSQLVKDSSAAEVAWSELKRDAHVPIAWQRTGASGNWWIHPSLSPDARWLAFASNEGGRSEVYISDFPSCSAKRRLSTGGGHTPRWRSDGNAIFFVGSGGMLMVARRPKAGWGDNAEPTKLFSLKHPLISPGPWYDFQSSQRRFLMIERQSETGGNRIELVLNWRTLLQPAS